MIGRLSSDTRQRLKLLALIALFAGPMLVAWIMVEWRVGIPDERVAHGELMPSLPPLAQWPLEKPNPVVESDDWVLAYACDGDDCEVVADRWWRLHRALGKDATRVIRLRLGAREAPLPGEVAGPWLQRPDWSDEGELWFIDPEGRVVLAYEAGQKADGVLDDVKRLLKMNPEPALASRE
ncbi:hypothetical protein SAMN05661010_00594 [Modicisalibacter muralis]|uniref:Transmembrane protein n=1 Tax=Modicisalibacter muralis TaxID=119000 RepID=A0A1G9G5A5_9GAMM|nr:hypothetical protein [Halomonas muralis]SDK95503.1 hypothetical protein SAMN05661010_00594 [Halomonas muralis]